MNIQTLKMKNSSKLMVLNYHSDHPPISAKHIHCCCAFKWNFNSIVKNKKLKYMEKL